MNQELPTINQFSNVSNTYALGDFGAGLTTSGAFGVGHISYSPDFENRRKQVEDYKYLDAVLAKRKEPESILTQAFKEAIKNVAKARVIQVFIADNDCNIEVAKRLLYKGEQLFTDLSDQDLFYDIEIKALITKHNEYRATVLNESKSTATEKVFLKPIKVSELSMVVAVLAEFK